MAPTPKPTPTNPPIIIPPKGGGAGGGLTGTGSTGIVFKTGETGKKSSDTDVLWNEGAYGQTLSYRTKTSAYNYMTQNVPEYKIVSESFNNWGKATYKKKTVKNFWKEIVNESSATGQSPWQILAYYNTEYQKNGEITTDTPSTTTYRAAGPKFIGTSRQQSDYTIQSAIKAMFNRDATKSEMERFYKQLNAGEKKAFRQANYNKGTGFSEQAFSQNFIADTLTKELGKKPNEELLGTAGQYQDQLQQYAEAMGLTKTNRELNRHVVDIIKGGNINDIMKEFKKDSMMLYTNLADRLSKDNPADLMQGLTVKDIVAPYTKIVEDVFGTIPGSTKLNDSLIQGAIGGEKLDSNSEFWQRVRKDSRFNKTDLAKQEAQDLGIAFLKSFGYGG